MSKYTYNISKSHEDTEYANKNIDTENKIPFIAKYMGHLYHLENYYFNKNPL